jgi:hypothetical protein
MTSIKACADSKNSPGHEIMLFESLNKLDNTIFCMVNSKIQNVQKGVNGTSN